MWRDSATFNPTAFPPPADFTDLLARFLQVQVDDRAELFICIAWFLWNRRNAIRLGKPSHLLHLIGSLAGRFLQEFQSAQERPPRTAQISPHNHWRPPDAQVFKANFDGATFNSFNAAGLGVVIRDNNSEDIGSLSMRISLPHSVAEVEALACRRAVKNGSAALSTYSHMAAFKFVTLRVKLGYDHHAGTCVQGKLENRKYLDFW